jgi:hypothetical protein
MDDLDRVREVKARVQGRLRAIPGVHSVGVGPKITGGRHTGQAAIVVFVEKKKPLSELSPNEVLPAEIDGIKTDIREAPKPQLISEDTEKYRPLLGGIQIQTGGPTRGFGTITCIARTDDPDPEYLALTCEHVVGIAQGAAPDLTITSAAGAIIFGGANTQGAIVVASINLTPPGGADAQSLEIIQRAPVGLTPTQVAQGVRDKLNALANPSVTAAAAGAQVTFTPAAGVGMTVGGTVYGLHFLDPDANIRATVVENVITTAGQATADGGAYIAINRGGAEPSHGVFAAIASGDNFLVVAASIAHAINVRAIAGVSATVTNGDVTVTGVEELECDIASDIRVGQNTHSFCSKCCPCCNDRIGRVIDASLDLDVALIQLDAGMKYKSEIQDVGVVTGSHFVTDVEVILPYNVHKRGRTTRVTHGTITALHSDGDVGGANLFHRHYIGCIAIQATTGTFAEPGDSGSALLNDAHEVIGIVFAAAGNMAWATPMQPILTAFNLIVEVADTAGVEHSVPTPAVHFAAIETQPVVAVNNAVEPPFAAAIMKHLDRAQNEITATSAGREYAEIARRHADEAMHLVNTNRRVATVWQRNGGPQILQAAIGVAAAPDRKLPEHIQGKPIVDCLRRIQQIFMRHGSAALADDLARLGPRVIGMAGLTYGQAIAALQSATQE